MSKKLTGKIALVTGASSGIGLAAAKRFVAEGAFVFITGRRHKTLDNAVKSIGSNVTAVPGDVSNLADLDRLFETIKKQKGHLDIVFANVGWGEFVPLGQITEEHFDKTFNANVKGLVFTVQKALPLLRDGSSIVLNASITSSTGTPAFSIYSASKAAVRSLARCWALDLKSRNIRVNVVSPGPIDTPGLRTLAPTKEQIPQFKAEIAANIPLGRIGEPEELASAVLFLASDESSFVNGIELFVDGGMAQI